MQEDRLLVSVSEAARRLGIGETACWALLHKGELDSVKIGRRRLVPIRSLEQFVENALVTA